MVTPFRLHPTARLCISRAACVVTQPWVAATQRTTRALINPANPQLAGTALAYFPVGGPCPPPPPPGTGSSAGWGGMEAGEGMLYPSQVVDGVVSTLGGAALRHALAAGGSACAVGEAVVTPAVGRLTDSFDVIAHTPPPFWPRSSDARVRTAWEGALRRCYVASVAAIVQFCTARRFPLWIASPLLGAGACGAPPAEAACVAASAVPHMLAAAGRDAPSGGPVLLRFVLQRPAVHEMLQRAVAEQRQSEPDVWAGVHVCTRDDQDGLGGSCTCECGSFRGVHC